jgi:hypothetical protein
VAEPAGDLPEGHTGHSEPGREGVAEQARVDVLLDVGDA